MDLEKLGPFILHNGSTFCGTSGNPQPRTEELHVARRAGRRLTEKSMCICEQPPAV